MIRNSLVLSFFSYAILFQYAYAQNNPAISSWLQNTSGIKGRHYVSGNSTPIQDNDSVNVQTVLYSSNWVYVRTKGIPAYVTGPFLDGNPSLASSQNAIFKFPLNPISNTGTPVSTTGGNIGVFNRWAYYEGASKVISFEPDRRYFKLLSLNADPRSVLFNAAVSSSVGTMTLHESIHLGGSNIFGVHENNKVEKYDVRTYTLDYLFESGLVDKIDFLKIDIEGAEHHALSGISDQNLMKVQNISMEYHHSFFDYDDTLRENLINRMVGLGFNSYLLFLGSNNALQMLYFSR